MHAGGLGGTVPQISSGGWEAATLPIPAILCFEKLDDLDGICAALAI